MAVSRQFKSIILFFAFLNLVLYSGCDEDDESPTPVTNTNQGSSGTDDSSDIPDSSIEDPCPTRPANVVTLANPIYSCNGIGGKTRAIMNDINEMWESQMIACSCGPDLPQCAMNALVLKPATFGAGALGYIYYDPNILQFLENAGSGSLLGPAWFLAHEAGHNIQNNFNVVFPSGKLTELSADCFAGYFIGWLVCNGRITEADINGLLAAICRTGDPTTSPWFAPNAHGTCQERIESTLRGLRAYLDGELSSDFCF